jgi:tRNA U34 2-thiouridine synthase MnmA/TrmU
LEGEAVCVAFDTPEGAVSPGHACVLYDAGDRVLGGGFIAETRAGGPSVGEL